MGYFSNETIAQTDRYDQALQILMDVGVVENCEAHNVYVVVDDGLLNEAYKRANSKLSRNRPQVEPFERRLLTDAMKQAFTDCLSVNQCERCAEGSVS